MPRIQVLSEVAGRDAEVMLTEHVPAEMLADDHYAGQLVERMGWALVDAEHHEQTIPLFSPNERGRPMGAQENKKSAQDAYAAFSDGDAETAMANIDESIEWTARGDNALTGTHRGKQAVGELWGRFMSTDFRTEPHEFVADGDKVVVLTTVHLGGETIESADVMTYNAEGKLVAFDTRADATVANRVFAP